jgi:hypothetical protein
MAEFFVDFFFQSLLTIGYLLVDLGPRGGWWGEVVINDAHRDLHSQSG